MKAKTFNIINICFISAVVLGLTGHIIYVSGVFRPEPKVEIQPTVTEGPELRVLSDIDYRPYSFKDGDKNSGYDIELMNLVANKLNMKLVLETKTWNEAIELVTDPTSTYDVLMTCDYSDSFPGVEKLTKSEPTSYDDFTVFSKMNVTSPNQLYSQKVGVMENGNAEKALADLHLDFTTYADNRTVMEALVNGEVDSVVIRNSVGNLLIKELGLRGVNSCISMGKSYMCYGIKSDKTELISKINTVLKDIKKSGEFDKLQDKWLTTFVRTYTFSEIIKNNLWIVIVFTLLILEVVVFILYNRQRKIRMQAENNKYMSMVDIISNDFESITYAKVEDDKIKDVSVLRVSDSFNVVIPEWEKEESFVNKLRIFCDNVVLEEDREYFNQMTAEEAVINGLNASGVYYVNFRGKLKDNYEYYQLKFVSSIKNGKIDSFSCGFHNIDEETRKEKEIQKDLTEAKVKVEQANQAKTEFLFNMSHDIRTPMNAVIGFTNIAKKNIDNKEKVIECLEKINSSGTHLSELINEVLDMSRVEAGKLKSDIKVVDVKSKTESIVEMYKSAAEENQVKLIYESNITNKVVKADELHVTQILTNIVGNAIKYSRPGKDIVFTVNELPNNFIGYATYEFIVKDNGIGMSKEFLGRIFDSFSREENENTSKIQGTGLGMSIVKRLVEYLDGSIDVDSELGVGTTVRVILSFQVADEEVKPELVTNNDVDSLKGKRVLIAEDNELNMEIALDILYEAGLVVETAKNGLEAVEKIKAKGAKNYDFVLMDIQMPLLDGYEATKIIREMSDSKDLVIIALSANAFQEDREKSISMGMNDHVAKPINITSLKNTMCKFVRK